MPAVAGRDPRISELFARLVADADGLVDSITTTLRRDVDFYAAIPADVVAEGVRADLVAALAGLGSAEAPGADELETAARVGGERAGQGVPLEALLQAFRVGGRELMRRARHDARDVDLDVDTQLDVVEAGLEWLDAVSEHAARGHREAELARMRADVHRRAAFLHAALHGTLSLAELHAQAATIGLDPTARLAAVRVRATADLPPHRLQALLAERGGGGRELVGIVDGDVAGVVARPPELPDTVAAGLGPELPFERVAESYASASEALAAAVAFGRAGVHLKETLALETAVLDERVGGVLERRCLGGLEAARDKGAALEETVRAYMEWGRRVEPTARALAVHPNTLRHRLARFEELTGLDLRRTRDLVAVWTALEHRRVAGGRAAAVRPSR